MELRFYETLGVLCGLAIIAAFVLAVYSSLPSSMRKRKAARLGDRGEMPPEEFYATYYAESGIPRPIVLELLKEIAESIEIPIPLIRPTDSFERELSDFDDEMCDGGMAEISFRAHGRVQLHGVRLEPGQIKTVDEYIRFFGILATSRASSFPQSKP